MVERRLKWTLTTDKSDTKNMNLIMDYASGDVMCTVTPKTHTETDISKMAKTNIMSWSYSMDENPSLHLSKSKIKEFITHIVPWSPTRRWRSLPQSWRRSTCSVPRSASSPFAAPGSGCCGWYDQTCCGSGRIPATKHVTRLANRSTSYTGTLLSAYNAT